MRPTFSRPPSRIDFIFLPREQFSSRDIYIHLFCLSYPSSLPRAPPPHPPVFSVPPRIDRICSAAAAGKNVRKATFDGATPKGLSLSLSLVALAEGGGSSTLRTRTTPQQKRLRLRRRRRRAKEEEENVIWRKKNPRRRRHRTFPRFVVVVVFR